MIGYRNAVYLPQEEKVRIYTWNEQGERSIIETSYHPYLMLENPNGEYSSIFNTPLRKRSFKSNFERQKYAKECGTTRVFENIAPVQQCLIDTYWKNNTDDDFDKFSIRTVTLDIEVYSPHEFPLAEQAKHPINIITIHDSLTNKLYSWGTKEYTHDRKNLVYNYCATEKQLLINFINFFADLQPDLLTGWNSGGFDIPYIINRINNTLGEEYSRDLSPVKKVYSRTLMSGMFGKPQVRWFIEGVSCVDYIDIYKRFSFKNHESYKLDFIAEVVLKERKVDYGNTNLASLSIDNWQLFVDYNIQDVELLVKMEQKLHYIKLLRMLSYLGLTTLENAMSTLSTITGTAAIKARKRGKNLPTFVRAGKEGQNPGAFVADPIEGFQSSVVSFDANSLYPNIMISLNLSPETKIGEIIDETDEKVTIRHVAGGEYSLTPANFQKFIKSEKIAITKAGFMFSQKVKGILPEIVDEQYQKRIEAREKMLELKGKAVKTVDDQEQIIRLNARQMCLKIFINSVYGYMGNDNAPIGDDAIASSITLTGQFVNKESRKLAREYVISKLGHDKFRDIAVAGDTDSVYITIEPLLKHYNVSLKNDDGSINEKVYELIEELKNYINQGIEIKMRNELNSTDPRIEFKREAIIDTSIFLGKKRYVAHVIDNEGIICDEWKYVGVEIARTTMPKAVKQDVKNIIETMLWSRNRAQTDACVNAAYERFKKMDVKDISFTTGIKNYEQYARECKDFTTGKGVPVHVKAAYFYNTILKRHNLTSTYELIQSGDKIKWMYLKMPNKYNVPVIAYKYYFPKEFEDIVKVDYEKMFVKIVFNCIERFYEAVKWTMYKPNEQMKTDLFELFS